MALSKNTLKTSSLAFFLILLVLLVGISLLIFQNKVTRIFKNNFIQNISEVQDLYSQTLKSKFQDQFNMLEAQARYFENTNLLDQESLKKTIKNSKGIGDFKKIAISSRDGSTTNYTGQTLANVKNKPYFTKTLTSGLPQISDKIELDENLEPTLAITYPIKNGKTVEAVLIGTLSYSVLKNLFSTKMFSGQSYNYIIANDGNIILCNKDKQKALYNVNFFDYLKNNSQEENSSINRMKINVINSNSDYILHKGKEGLQILTYAPLGINNWYIVSVMPFTYISQQQAAVSKIVTILLVIISVTIFSFIFAIYLLFRKNANVEKANERLTIANSQAQSLIFEYDIQKQSVDFSGDTQFIFGTDKTNFSIDFIKTEFYKRIHEDDVKSITEHLKNSILNKTSDFSSEFRYKTFSNEYIWLRMTGTLIKEKEGKAEKFIGTINNVNAQVLKEQELRSQAESDKLTGLLNKSAMEMHVKQYLDEEAEGNTCALFIIDLDNFKKVNDTLGHLIGDMAILDTAKKLSLIFSEKDLIGRFGGDEFCILLRLNPQMDSKTKRKVIQDKAKNICMLLKEDYFDEKNCIEVSSSIGIAVYPESGSTYEELFQNADTALYDVKTNGKNSFKIFK